MDAPTMNCSGQSAPAVASLACALRVGEEVFREALQKAPTLPKLADVGRAPATLADAISARDAKEEERRRREAVRKDVKIKGKQVTPLPAVVEQAAPAPTPGLHIGNVNESSAFWMFVEDYFRDITQEDIMALMPVAPDPEEDDCLTVPFFGRDPRHADRSGLVKGKQALSREEDDTLERRGRGRGAGKLDLRLSDTPAAPGSASHMLMPQTPPLPLHLTPDVLVQGMRPDGRQAANMLEACTDEEARSFCALAHTLGLLDEDGGESAGLPGQRLDGRTLMSLDRPQLEKLLRKVIHLGESGEGEAAGAGLIGRQGGSEAGADGTTAPGRTVAGISSDALGDDDSQSSNKGTLHELPRAACGDFMHPYLRAVLKRPCTAYVLNPCAGTGSLVESTQDEEEGGPGGSAAGGGAPSGKGSRGGLAPSGSGGGSTYLAKTPAASRGMGVPKMQSITPADAQHAAMLMHQSSALDSNALALSSGMSAPMLPGGVTPQDSNMLLPQLAPMSQAQHQAQEDFAAGGLLSAVTPPLGAGFIISAADKAAAARGGRARNSVNYSALAGKKDKERERELREREREERERAKTVAPKAKRKPGPRGGASWGSGGPGGGAAALAGLQKPPTNNPLALLNKAPLLFKDEPWLNATTAAVHTAVAQGGLEGALEQQWTQLDAASDVMAMAPDDEILAELLALQTELVQQVAINRAREAVVMEAILTDLPLQRAANQQRADMEEQIRMYLQRKAEVKRNLKREKREMEKRQALAALNEPASPRAMTGRPKKFAGLLAGGYDGMGAGLDGAGADGAADAWRGAMPTTSGGEGAAMELMPAAEDFELVDSLAQRTHDEEALCAICGDGQSMDPNMIVFCERCDVAVHQHCYGVRSIPADEWLCWPCRLYEESQRAAGVPQNEIRPKRWEMEARGITHAELPGGSHAAGCCLCPVRSGAFKRTTDGKAWCHVVCALWHDGPTVLPVDAPDAIDNISAIKPERWRSPCGLCQRVAGAVVKCNFGHCQAYFHPLCGRRAGNYLVARIQPGSKALRYRAYCHNHSEGQRNKDLLTGAAARISDVYPAPPPGPKPLRRGASSVALLGGGSPGDGEEAVAGGLSSGVSPLAMPFAEPDPVAVAAAAGGASAVPGGVVKRRFGRPPKIQKQQQLLQLQLSSLPPNLPNAGSEIPDLHQSSLPSSLPPGSHLPVHGGTQGLAPVDSHHGSPATLAGLLPAPPGRPPLPRDRLSLSAMARRKAAASGGAAGGPSTAAASSSSSGAAGGMAADAAVDTAAAAAGPASGRASVEPLFGLEMQGHRTGGGRAKGLTGRNTVAGLMAAGGGGVAGTSLEGFGGDGGGLGPAEVGEGSKSFRPGKAKGAAGAAPKATSSKTSSGAAGVGPSSARAAGASGAQAGMAGMAAPSLSGAGQGTAGGPFATASSAPTGGPKQRGNRVAVKEEPTADGAVVPGPSPTSAAAAAAATARAAAAAADAAAAGGSGAPATLERLAYLEHQRSMLGRWGPSSVRQELELLRTMADTVRRRERCKKAQYRLLREALSGQDSQPAAALAFLESWEWPECGGSPFSSADLQEPPPVTVLDHFLEANRAAAAVGAGAGLGGSGGGGGGVKRHRSGAADSGAGGSGGGAGEDAPPAKRLKLKEHSPGAGTHKEFSKETLKEIMSGRDWRRRVVMVDGKWVPRPSEGRGSARGPRGTPGADGVSSSSKASRDEAGLGQAEDAATPELEEAADYEEFVDAEEGFPEAEVEEKEADVGMTDTGQEAGAERPGGDSGSRTTSTMSARRGDGAANAGGVRGGSYEGGGEVHSGGGRGSEFADGSLPPGDGGRDEMDPAGSVDQHCAEDGGGSGGNGGARVALLDSPNKVPTDQWRSSLDPQADEGAEGRADGGQDPEGLEATGEEATPDLDLVAAGVFAAGACENEVEGGGSERGGVEEPRAQLEETAAEDGLAEAASAAEDGGQSAAVSNASPSQKESEDDNASSDDAPIAALSRGVKLPREARPLMTERTADTVNAKLPRGFRFEKAP